jgi:hypothetical protein
MTVVFKELIHWFFQHFSNGLLPFAGLFPTGQDVADRLYWDPDPAGKLGLVEPFFKHQDLELIPFHRI